MNNLASIQTPTGFFTIAPFDHRGSLAAMFDLDINTAVGKEAVTQLKVLFMEAFSEMCSGILVDPQYGFAAVEKKAKNTGLILSLESSGYTDDRSAVPTMINNWSVRDVKNNYAVAKLLVYYHPAETNANAKKKLVIELGEYCRQEEVAFLVEPVIYNPAGKDELPKTDFQEAQLETMIEFQHHCDVLKVQYPGDALACATITAELDVPWILLSRGMKFEQFKAALQVSLENGARGFAAGRSIWQEIGQFRTKDKLPDLAGIQNFLATTGKQRMLDLIALTAKYQAVPPLDAAKATT